MDKRTEKQIVLAVGQYFSKTEFDTSSITSIDVSQSSEGIEVSFLSKRPGILIGHHGKYIQDLKEYLEKRLKTEIYLKIKEDTD